MPQSGLSVRQASFPDVWNRKLADFLAFVFPEDWTSFVKVFWMACESLISDVLPFLLRVAAKTTIPMMAMRMTIPMIIFASTPFNCIGFCVI